MIQPTSFRDRKFKDLPDAWQLLRQGVWLCRRAAAGPHERRLAWPRPSRAVLAVRLQLRQAAAQLLLARLPLLLLCWVLHDGMRMLLSQPRSARRRCTAPGGRPTRRWGPPQVAQTPRLLLQIPRGRPLHHQEAAGVHGRHPALMPGACCWCCRHAGGACARSRCRPLAAAAEPGLR
jgi:hypothetical protein